MHYSYNTPTSRSWLWLRGHIGIYMMLGGISCFLLSVDQSDDPPSEHFDIERICLAICALGALISLYHNWRRTNAPWEARVRAAALMLGLTTVVFIVMWTSIQWMYPEGG